MVTFKGRDAASIALTQMAVRCSLDCVRDEMRPPTYDPSVQSEPRQLVLVWSDEGAKWIRDHFRTTEARDARKKPL